MLEVILMHTIYIHTTTSVTTAITTNTYNIHTDSTNNTNNNTHSDDRDSAAPSNLKPKTNKKLKSPHIKAAEKAELDSQRSLSEIG